MKLIGEQVLAATLSEPANVAPAGGVRAWQYHSRSDHHSKVASVCILLDFLGACDLARRQAAEGRLSFGINRKLNDFASNKDKTLDLVLTRGSGGPVRGDLRGLVFQYGLRLGEAGEDALARLPALGQSSNGAPLLAVEAKACMTEHAKARPRLFDELTSSFRTVNGHANNIIAAAHVIVNVSDRFLSPGRQQAGSPVWNEHAQPQAAANVLSHLRKLKRRSFDHEAGFDAVGITLVSLANDGTPVALLPPDDPRFPIDTALRYKTMIQRLVTVYENRFSSL